MFHASDMLKAKDGEFFITDWLRNRNTLEFIGIWERIYNLAFNYGEFATIKNQAGLNSFKIGVQEFTARTNAMSASCAATKPIRKRLACQERLVRGYDHVGKRHEKRQRLVLPRSIDFWG